MNMAMLWLAVVVSSGIVSGSAEAALATQTPTASEACQVAPRELPLVAAGAARREAATPAPIVVDAESAFALPTGSPADDTTISAVTATVIEAIACRNAGDFLRAYALFTDDMLATLFGGQTTVDPEIMAAIAQRARPVPEERRIALHAVSDVTVLADGRVGAVVETRGVRRNFRDFLIFVWDDDAGRWLIDATETLPDDATT